MNAALKKKLCWNCEGRVPLEAENCPYCAVYLGADLGERNKADNAVLAPPYRIVETEEQEQTPPDSPYPPEQESGETEKAATLPETSSPQSAAKVLLPLILLSGGLLFFLFGAVLYLFSVDGVLNLQWNGKFWYVYLALAIPMLIIGWRYLRNFDADDNPR